MDFLIFTIFAAMALGLFMSWIKADTNAKRAESVKRSLKRKKGFRRSQCLLSTDAKAGVALDDTGKKVCLIKFIDNNVSMRVIGVDKLLSSRIIENGSTITKTSRASQAGGALAGGLVLGGIGAIVGGLSGKTNSTRRIKKVDLQITIADTRRPIHTINLMDVEGNEGGLIHAEALKKAEHWRGLISVLIREAKSRSKEEDNL